MFFSLSFISAMAPPKVWHGQVLTMHMIQKLDGLIPVVWNE